MYLLNSYRSPQIALSVRHAAASRKWKGRDFVIVCDVVRASLRMFAQCWEGYFLKVIRYSYKLLIENCNQ